MESFGSREKMAQTGTEVNSPPSGPYPRKLGEDPEHY